MTMSEPGELYRQALVVEAKRKEAFEAWWRDGKRLHPSDRSGPLYERDKMLAWYGWYACAAQFETVTGEPKQGQPMSEETTPVDRHNGAA